MGKEQVDEEQRLSDFKLQREAERASKQAELEMSRCQHEVSLKEVQAEAKRRTKEQEHELELKRLREIKTIDANADIGSYLIARESKLPPVVQCGTLMSGQAPNIQSGSGSRDVSDVLANFAP